MQRCLLDLGSQSLIIEFQLTSCICQAQGLKARLANPSPEALAVGLFCCNNLCIVVLHLQKNTEPRQMNTAGQHLRKKDLTLFRDAHRALLDFLPWHLDRSASGTHALPLRTARSWISWFSNSRRIWSERDCSLARDSVLSSHTS